VTLYERVHTVWDYYDGILNGVADFRGSPHYYSVIRKDVDPVDTYELQEIGAALLDAVAEQWVIYRHWERQFHSGQVTVETHPGNGGTNARYDQLEATIRNGIASLESPRVVASGEFRPTRHQSESPKGCLAELEVQWTPAT
jgi:hypothetical protein